MRAILGCVVSFALTLVLLDVTQAEPIATGQQLTFRTVVEAIDGDTISVVPNVRLVGCNTGERGKRAKCTREDEVGKQARQRLKQLIAGGDLDLTYVPCSCKPGTEGTPSCNSGRFCGVLKAKGRDVCDILISEGLAAPFKCGKTSAQSHQIPGALNSLPASE